MGHQRRSAGGLFFHHSKVVAHCRFIVVTYPPHCSHLPFTGSRTHLHCPLRSSDERLRVCVRIPKETSNTLVATVLGGLQMGIDKKLWHHKYLKCLHIDPHMHTHTHTYARSSRSSCPMASSQGVRSTSIFQNCPDKRWSP